MHWNEGYDVQFHIFHYNCELRLVIGIIILTRTITNEAVSFLSNFKTSQNIAAPPYLNAPPSACTRAPASTSYVVSFYLLQLAENCYKASDPGSISLYCQVALRLVIVLVSIIIPITNRNSQLLYYLPERLQMKTVKRQPCNSTTNVAIFWHNTSYHSYH